MMYWVCTPLSSQFCTVVCKSVLHGTSLFPPTTCTVAFISVFPEFSVVDFPLQSTLTRESNLINTMFLLLNSHESVPNPRVETLVDWGFSLTHDIKMYLQRWNCRWRVKEDHQHTVHFQSQNVQRDLPSYRPTHYSQVSDNYIMTRKEER